MITRHDFKNPGIPFTGPALRLPTLALALGAAFMMETAPARTIQVNFTGGTAETGSTLSGPAGGLGTTWNQFNGPNSPGTLVDSTGAATTVAITSNFDLPNTFDTPVLALPMLRGSMTNFGKGVDNTNVTISGLAAGGIYDVWLVTLRNQPFSSGTPSGTEQYVGWWSTTNTTFSSSSQLVDARGATINTSTFVEGYNYVLFENVVANGSGQIVFSGVAGPLLNGSNNDHRLGLNGLQIQDSTPVTAGPVDDAMSTVESSPAAVFANGVSTATVKVTLRDSNGVRVPNKEVTLANTAGPQDATIDPPTALTTNSQGEAGFAVRSGTVGTEIFTATVVADNLTLTDTASVEFTDTDAPLAFNVNFHAGSPAAGLLGVVGDPGETWNQGTSSASNLTDASGTVASTVNVTGLPDMGSTVSAALNVFDDNRAFFAKGQDTTLSITGLLPDTAYDLYIYALSHNLASWGQISDTERAKGDFVTSNSVLGNGQSQWLDNAVPGTNGSAFVPNGNYVVFQSIITNGSGNISILADAYDGLDGNSSTGDGDCRLHISGLQIRPASGMSVDYMTWRNSYPGLGLPGEDDDGDGLSNDFERIFGLNPKSAASASPYPAPFDSESGLFSYSRRKKSMTNLNYKVWASTDLENWFEDNASVQSITSTAGDVEIMGTLIDPALLAEPRLFLQVRATPVTGIDLEPSLLNIRGSGNTITLIFSEPMNPSSAGNPNNYNVVQDGVGPLAITGATLNPGGGSVTLTLASPLGIDTAYTVSVDGVTSGTGQSLGSNVTRPFRTWDDDPNGIKVFVLAGQSNMVGQGESQLGNGGVVGAIGSLRYQVVNDNANFGQLVVNSGNPATDPWVVRNDVKVWWNRADIGAAANVSKGGLTPGFGLGSGQFGPEYGFGWVVGNSISQPVLVIKTAWGGRDLITNFRPPGAVAARGGVVGTYYVEMIEQVREILHNLATEFPEWNGLGYQIAGFGWHHGWNDSLSTFAANEYEANMANFITDIRAEFGKPALPFSIGTTGMEGAATSGNRLTVVNAQIKVANPALHPELGGNVFTVDTRPFAETTANSPTDDTTHWKNNGKSMYRIGKGMGDGMVDLLTP
jgi:alpha-galactosidase